MTRRTKLVLSMHVPKTGGTTFAEVLRRAYGKRVAFFYGPEHPDTHPLLRGLGKTADRDVVEALEAAGVVVLHGHFAASVFAGAVPDPARYWIWLREPVERTISHFHFFRGKHAPKSALGSQVLNGVLPLPAFAAHPAVRNLQSRYVAPFPVAELGFVGITEQLSAGVGLLGLPVPAGRRAAVNVNADKPATDKLARAAIAAENIADMALYSEGVQVFRDRLGRLDTARAPRTGGLLSRTLAALKGG
jgi:hypothetical protein